VKGNRKREREREREKRVTGVKREMKKRTIK
jgi:hypothetical protein